MSDAGGAEAVRDAGYDDWLDAVADDRGYALVCEHGHGSLPPRRRCPHCASDTLREEPLPATGTVVAATTVAVATPGFADDVPYTTAIASFDTVRLTGVVRGVDPDDVERGLTVVPRVEERETTGERLLVLRPASS